jgi:hypothetical protein
MKKILFVLLAFVFVSPICLGFSAPPSAYQGQEIKIITGEVVSVSMRTFDVSNDKGERTTLTYKFGTTNSWLSAMDTLGALKDKKVEVTYFITNDNQTIAKNIRDLGATDQNQPVKP